MNYDVIDIFYHVVSHTCRENLEVTDDVSIVEYLKHPVYITEGSYTNIKVGTTTPLKFFP